MTNIKVHENLLRINHFIPGEYHNIYVYMFLDTILFVVSNYVFRPFSSFANELRKDEASQLYI